MMTSFKFNLLAGCFLLVSGQKAYLQEALLPTPASYAAEFDQPYSDATNLAKQLTAPFQTEADKAEAIFTWIAHHVRYDCTKFHNPRRPEIRATSKAELERKIKEQAEKEIEATAKSKKGVCEDYSQLFKSMCLAVGLEAEVVHGVARDFYRPYRSSQNNKHAWNAVKIDGQWHLLDATWAAGYTDAEVKKFTRKVGTGFFKTTPAWFTQNHFPDDPKWQLMENPLDKNAFPKQPLINYGQTEYAFEDFSNTVAAVQGKGYDREIKFKLKHAPAYFQLTTSRSKPIEFSHSKEGGYEVFRFSGRGLSDVVIFGGESEHGRKGWLAQYDL